MLIFIPDDIAPSERRKHVMYQQIKYALDKFNGSRFKAAKFLGISDRSLRLWINRNPDVTDLRIYRPEEEKFSAIIIDVDQFEDLEEFLEFAKSKSGYRYCDSEEERANLLKKLTRYYNWKKKS
jgi:hypothetical protein